METRDHRWIDDRLNRLTGSWRVPWGWRDVGAALLTTVGTVIIAIVLLRLGAPLIAALERGGVHQGLSPHVFALVLSEAVVYAAAALGIWLCIVRPYGLPLRALGFRRVPLARLGIVLLAYPITLFVAGAVMALVVRYLLHGTFTNPQAQQITGGVTRTLPNQIALFLLVAVLAPLVEETIFRGVLYTTLRKTLPVWLAVVLSAALFAAAHAIPIIFPWLFITGVALALVYETCDSLLCSALLHGLINGGSLIALFATLPSA